ncbi:histone acetyltransferase [Marinomonas sp. S3726]|uniref:GNAT family N-acetyltransferase n=1 Tax=Marinomonas sp. S3726 TaxID=579484 RepID=UPI0005FA675B|nr:GNAT family N-acetyltransferase [Marinomonas sp. S3726]KJZ11249.1 histone acetyltransferase [Marinomonas sp. S3726]
MKIDLIVSPSDKEISDIYNGLSAFNEPYFPDLDETSLGYFYRNEGGCVLGGAVGKLIFTAFHLKYFWLSEPLRGLGYGTQVLKLMEQEAIKRGAINMFLDTYSFQAPEFYESAGYQEVGRFADYPKAGVDKIFYQKHL